MAQNISQPGSTRSYLAAATVTAGRFVKMSTTDTVTPVSGTTDIPVGVALEATASTTTPITVQHSGVCHVEVATAGCTCGAQVKIDSSGCVQDATPTDDEVLVGIALETGTDGNYVPVLLMTAFKNA